LIGPSPTTSPTPTGPPENSAQLSMPQRPRVTRPLQGGSTRSQCSPWPFCAGRLRLARQLGRSELVQVCTATDQRLAPPTGVATASPGGFELDSTL
jgi:hypothetical protein